MTNIEYIFQNKLCTGFLLKPEQVKEQIQNNIKTTELKLKSLGYLVGAQEFSQMFWNDFLEAFEIYSANLLENGLLPFDESILDLLNEMASKDYIVAYCNNIVSQFGLAPEKRIENLFLSANQNLFSETKARLDDTISALSKGIANNKINHEKSKIFVEENYDIPNIYGKIHADLIAQKHICERLEEKIENTLKEKEQIDKEYVSLVKEIQTEKYRLEEKQKNKKNMTKEELSYFKHEKKAWKKNIYPILSTRLYTMTTKSFELENYLKLKREELDKQNQKLDTLEIEYEKINEQNNLYKENSKAKISLKSRIDFDTSLLNQLIKNQAKGAEL